jgi:c-di-GMP-binding flagellar brake protein YcgR
MHMTEGTIKTSKYEIIAIFREELRKRTEIEIFFNNTSIITQLTRVDFAEFHIQTHRKIPSGHKIRFLLHSDSGKIEFNAALTKHDNSGVDKGIRYAFSLPECLQVVQRRRDPRFRLRHEHDFYCRGRHKNGENYLFDIKDISDGGCALMTKTPNLKFLSHNALLKNAVLCLQNMARSPSTWWSKMSLLSPWITLMKRVRATIRYPASLSSAISMTSAE